MRPEHLLWAVLALMICSAQVPCRADESLDELRKKKVEVADEWWRAMVLTQDIYDTERFPAARALRNALIKAAKTKEERVEAATIYYDQMKHSYERINRLYKDRVAGGEPRRWLEVNYGMLEAETWLMEEKAKESLDDLRKKKVEVAEEWVKTMSLTREIYDSERFPACRALRDARLEIAKTKQERVEAANIYYLQMKQFFERINILHENQSAGGEPRRWNEAKYRMLEAQIWLMEEKARR